MEHPTRAHADVVDRDVESYTNDGEEFTPYVPQTPLGRRLMEIRRRIVASGQPLLDWDEIEHEVAERRGGIAGDEA